MRGAQWRVTREMMEQEISEVRKEKTEHSGEKAGPKRRIGSGVPGCRKTPWHCRWDWYDQAVPSIPGFDARP